MNEKNPIIRKELIKEIEVKRSSSDVRRKLTADYNQIHPTDNDKILETFEQWVLKVTGVNIGD